MRQVLVYFPHEMRIGHRTPPVDVPGEQEKPARVWTLYRHTDPDAPPPLPFVPRHHVNAFLEDYVHDWTWRAGRLHYGSRAVPGKVWLLLEYAT